MIARIFFRIFLMLCLLGTSEVLAQSKNDSLLHVYHSGKADGSTYNALIWVYVFNQPDSAIYFGTRGAQWCRRSKNDSLLASIHNRTGVAYDIKSMPDSALHFYGLALSEARKKGNKKTEAGALNNIGLIAWKKGEAEKAVENYIKAARIFEKIDDKSGLGNAYNNIALILYEDDQLSKSREYHFKALRVREKAEDQYGIAASYSNLAQLYTSGKDAKMDSAIYYLEAAIPIKIKLNDQYGLSRSYHSLADLYNDLSRIDEALEFHLKALHIQLELGNSEGYASSYYNLSNIFRKKGSPKMELAYLDSAQLHAEKHQDMALLWKIYLTKAEALGRSGRTDEAHLYWIAYDHLKDSIVNLERSKQVEELETRYRTAEKDKEIAEHESALFDSELKLANRNKWIFGLTGLMVSLLLLGFALFQSYQRKAQSEKDAAIIEERELGLKAIIDATEDERKRIAKDLHDGIVQSLTGLSLRMQRQVGDSESLSEKQRGELRKSQSILDEAIGEVRGISHRMMPRVLSESGLILAIDDMLSKSLGNSEIHYEFEHHMVENLRFKENIEVSLYRILQELVNNIIKHSEAKAVSVQLLGTKSHLVLVVEDNGKGFTFEDSKNRNGIGLMNITSRAKALNGEVHYEPSPQHGTVATIRIPIA